MGVAVGGSSSGVGVGVDSGGVGVEGGVGSCATDVFSGELPKRGKPGVVEQIRMKPIVNTASATRSSGFVDLPAKKVSRVASNAQIRVIANKIGERIASLTSPATAVEVPPAKIQKAKARFTVSWLGTCSGILLPLSKVSTSHFHLCTWVDGFLMRLAPMDY